MATPPFKPQAPINFGISTPTAIKANPSVASSLSIGGSGQALQNGQPIQPQNVQTAGALTSALLPTSSGGISFKPATAAAYKTPAISSPTVSAPTSAAASLNQFLIGNQSTPNGGSVSTLGGNISGYTPSPGYSIVTSTPAPSSALGGNTMSGLQNSHKSYSDYVNALSQAQGYGSDYISALQGQYGAQTQGAQLGLNAAQYGLNSAALNSNYYTGNNLPGDTLAYAQGATAKAQAQNTLEQAGNTVGQAQNSIQQLAANQALNTSQLKRTGDISSAQTQLQYSPEGMAGSNAIGQYNSLQQAYPGASIPEYNQALTPEQNQQIASYIVANSPAYKSQFQSTYSTPGGGTGIYSKLDVGSGGFQQNQDGSYTLVPAAAAALGAANANVVQTQLGNLSNINSAINASTKTLQTTQQFMNQYGLNQSGVSILSQIQNSTNKQLDKAGAVAGLNADLNALRADYAQYLIGRGGSVAGTNEEANKAIPDTISPSQLQTLVQQMQTVGQNTADAVSTQVNQALSGITNNRVPTSGATSTGSGWGSLGD